MPVAHPVIVGIGQITYHPEEHSDFLHPLQGFLYGCGFQGRLAGGHGTFRQLICVLPHGGETPRNFGGRDVQLRKDRLYLPLLDQVGLVEKT